MGRDINLQTAVLVSVEEMAPFFKSIKLARAFMAYFQEFDTITFEWLIHAWLFDQEDRPELVKYKGGNGLFFSMRSLTYEKQEADEQWTVFGSSDIDLVVRLWNMYLALWSHYSGQGLPLISSIKSFSRAREGKWGIERLDRPYLVFESEDLFEKKLTSKGQHLQNVLGRDIAIQSWANVSE